LRFIVGPDGSVQQVEVVKPLGMGLDEAAIATVRTWKFEPGTLDGKPVAVKLSADVSFSLITDCKEKKIRKPSPENDGKTSANEEYWVLFCRITVSPPHECKFTARFPPSKSSF